MRRSGEDRIPTGWLERVTLRRIHVHTRDDQTIEGTLTVVAADGLVLTAAILHQSDNPSIPMAGDVFVPSGRIAFVQDVPGQDS